jgi:branched-chain amino acid transport system permease protein
MSAMAPPARRSGAARRLRSLPVLIAPVSLIVIVGLIGSATSIATQQNFITAEVSATIVIGLYIFVGNSGVFSFGTISFTALGAFAAGEMTIPTQTKHLVLPGLWSFIATHSIGNVPSLVLGAGLGALFAFLVGIPIVRLSGIAAGIATFAVLEITYNLFEFWTKIGPGAQSLALVPTTTGVWQATIGAVIAAVVALLYQSSRRGRLLRATREDPAAAQAIGVNIRRERLLAFTLSGAVAGFGGALLVHQLGSIIADQVYIDLTFLTLAMLVIGGMGSLWGATLGAILISLLDSYLSQAANGLSLGLFTLTLPSGTSDLVLGVLMAAMLIFRPGGLTGGREFVPHVPAVIRRRLTRRRAGSGVAPTETPDEGAAGDQAAAADQAPSMLKPPS